MQGNTTSGGAGGGRGVGGGGGKGGGRGGGRGGGGRMGGKGPGTCICPSCGQKAPHVPGKPCFEQPCPSCGTAMIRE